MFLNIKTNKQISAFFFSAAQEYKPLYKGWNLPNQEMSLIITSSKSLCIWYTLILRSFQKHRRASCNQRMKRGSQKRRGTPFLALLLCLRCCLASCIPSSPESPSYPIHVITGKRISSWNLFCVSEL